MGQGYCLVPVSFMPVGRAGVLRELVYTYPTGCFWSQSGPEFQATMYSRAHAAPELISCGKKSIDFFIDTCLYTQVARSFGFYISFACTTCIMYAVFSVYDLCLCSVESHLITSVIVRVVAMRTALFTRQSSDNPGFRPAMKC